MSDHAQMMIDDENEIDIIIWGAMEFSKTKDDVKEFLTKWGKPEYFEKYFEIYKNSYPKEHILKDKK